MFGTIFRRQFFIYIGNLLLVFVILGAALAGIFRSYFYEQKSESLIKQCERMRVEFFVSGFRPAAFGGGIEAFENEIRTLYYYTEESFFFCYIVGEYNGDGDYTNLSVAYGSKTPNLAHWDDSPAAVNKAITDATDFSRLTAGEIVTFTGTMGGIFDERMMIVSYPVSYRNDIYGVIFMNTPLAEIEESTREIIKLTLMSLFASALMAFILVFFSSRAISKPIHQINDVAKVIAAGSFDRRLTVKSRDEVGQLAESFNNMAESLENQEISRRAFISNISHDLRSPLTSMKGFIQAMLDGTIEQDKHEKYLRIVLDETERITRMANDLMFIGKFQNFDMEMSKSKFDVNELIRTTLITFEQRINDKRLCVTVSFADEKNMVEADCEKIQRVIYNLIDNAVKYTNPGGGITIKTAADPRRTGKIVVSVRDDGPGIAPEEHKKIFDRFYKSDRSRGQDKSGSGLGLAIVKEFIQAHGESVRLVSEPGSGSEFAFTLPLVSV